MLRQAGIGEIGRPVHEPFVLGGDLLGGAHGRILLAWRSSGVHEVVAARRRDISAGAASQVPYTYDTFAVSGTMRLYHTKLSPEVTKRFAQGASNSGECPAHVWFSTLDSGCNTTPV